MRIEDISELPEAMQRQVREKMGKVSPSSVCLRQTPSPQGEGFGQIPSSGSRFQTGARECAPTGNFDRGPSSEIPSSGFLRKPPSPQGEGFGEKRNKYGNRRVELNGVKFDSKKEAMRYLTLLDMEKRGEIQDLRLQPQFTLQEAYTTTEGVRVRAIRYQADFSYTIYNVWDREEKRIVEDVKSKATKTRVYEIKKKLLREKFHVEIREI